MGNKVALAEEVANLISGVDVSRPLVDLFGGMCSVAGAVSSSNRKVWVNDAQHYAELVARCLLQSQDGPPSRERFAETLLPAYRANLRSLTARFTADLDVEKQALVRDRADAYLKAQSSWQHAGNDETIAEEVGALREKGQSGPYRLATLTFAWGYFGLRQSIEIDSLRAAIDAGHRAGDLSADEAAWCRLALLQACSRAASAPGHFAQFLNGRSVEGYRRIRSARRRTIWDGLLDDLSQLRGFGTKKWRARNKVLRGDALKIWSKLDGAGLPPAIFYADPPYSKEQYSRYYHVLETLELYDYPEAIGAGRYRPDRFTTALARKSGVLEATRTLCREIARRDGVLMLSYPSSGLLTKGLQIDVEALLGEFFENVTVPIATKSAHSTLGARHGAASRSVTEYLWMAR